MEKLVARNGIREIGDLALFVFVVEFGGIAKCASMLGYERTTISRRIARLEKGMGVELLVRNHNRVKTTEAGDRCYRHGAGIIQSAEDARRAVVSGQADPRRTIVVGASIATLKAGLSSILDQFNKENSSAPIAAHPMEVWDEELSRILDCAVVFGPIKSKAVKVTELCLVPNMLVASPAYLAVNGEPQAPRELAGHRVIVDDSFSRPERLSFDNDSCIIELKGSNAVRVSGILEAREAVKAGLGLGCLPAFVCESLLESGELKQVLSDYSVNSRPIYLVNHSSAGVRKSVVDLRLLIEQQLPGKVRKSSSLNLFPIGAVRLCDRFR